MGVEIEKKFETIQLNNKKFPGSVCVRGQEFLASVSTSSASVGTNLATVYLNPLALPGTRLEKYGQLYDKFLFKKLRIIYASGLGTSTAGQYILAFDRDYADTTPPASSAGVQQYFSMANSKIANAWESSSLDTNLTSLQDFYYTNDTGVEGRIVYQGQIYVAAVSGSTFTGSVVLDYEIELYDPQIETEAGALQAQAGTWTGTTEDIGSDWFQGMTAVFGSDSRDNAGITFEDDQDGKRYLSIPPGSYTMSISGGGYINTQSQPSAFLQFYAADRDWYLTKEAITNVTSAIENVNNLLNLFTTGRLSPPVADSWTYSWDFTVPFNVGRVLLFVASGAAFLAKLRALSMQTISLTQAASGSLVRDSLRLKADETPPPNLRSLHRRLCHDSASVRNLVRDSAKLSVKDNSNRAEEGEDGSEENEFIDRKQVELFKQFVSGKLQK